ncbi:hypothetical protein ACLI08_14135 [Flavobacterium sp. RNTU_13]|uniref:hypothetical protein n=1 Tax=Flavobacterium sp. RNTU_13 TaxID=3375145 RepID=UPI0039875264
MALTPVNRATPRHFINACYVTKMYLEIFQPQPKSDYIKAVHHYTERPLTSSDNIHVTAN